jgi:hypothetical protein
VLLQQVNALFLQVCTFFRGDHKLWENDRWHQNNFADVFSSKLFQVALVEGRFWVVNEHHNKVEVDPVNQEAIDNQKLDYFVQKSLLEQLFIDITKCFELENWNWKVKDHWDKVDSEKESFARIVNLVVALKADGNTDWAYLEAFLVGPTLKANVSQAYVEKGEWQ